MIRKQKLELTWIGKENRPKLEPRILLEDPEKSYHAPHRVTDQDIFDNKLIFGDNLLALKALEQEFTGKVKCIFIDPPYNTGSAFTHYDDGIEHSIWLNMMRDRLEILRKLLNQEGSIWITLDDNEVHYCKVLCDEVFGRNCFITSISWRISDNSNNNALTFSEDHNNILVYGRKPNWKPKFLNDDNKRSHFKNPDNDPRGPWFDGNPVNNPGWRPNLQFNITSPTGHIIKHPPNGWRWSKETIDEKLKTGELRFSVDGKRLIRRTYLKELGGLPPSNLWVDLEETGHTRQAKYELKGLFPDVKVTDLFSTPKPEKLIKRVVDLATGPGDLVLDSFAGSGTTGAVAHKMGRRWIMVELGEHCHTHIIPRLKKVIDGEDKGGITEAVNWKGGGGFRYHRLAPSLLEKDKWGNWVIKHSASWRALLMRRATRSTGNTVTPQRRILST
jgi:adenine-specific DNA-methyltransferase